MPELSRTYRAHRRTVRRGKIDEAIAEVRAGLAVLPGNVDVAIGFVPDLDRAGKKKEADEIYGKVETALSRALKDYGSSPDLRNSIAWTMVNCNRDLDDALKHAQKAVEQAPRTAGYIDTLAEVYFRKKDRVKALELMEQSPRWSRRTRTFASNSIVSRTSALTARYRTRRRGTIEIARSQPAAASATSGA